MVATNTDVNKTSQTNKSEANVVLPEVLSQTTSTTKQTIRDCELDLLGCTSSSSNISRGGSINCNIPLSTSCPTKSTSTLIKLQGQRWQHYLDFEKIIKQLRYAEKVHTKLSDVDGSFPNSSSKSSSTGAGTAIKSNIFKYAQQQKQVQRLNGNEMHYYGLAPKQEALEIVICNVCKGIYTKIGFSNHMIMQHASLWNSVPTKVMTTEVVTTSKNSPDSPDERLRDFDRIEFVGLSSDSSATAFSSTSLSSTSSLISSFGGTTRAAKGNRNSNSSSTPTNGSTVSSGRSRSKGNKNHTPSSTTTTTLPNVGSTLSPSTIVNELNSTSSSSSKTSMKKLTGSSNHTTTQQSPPVLSNSTAKVLPTFGISQTTTLNSNPSSMLGISTFSNSSNSSTSSSSSTSSKTSSQSTNSTPSLTFPNLRSMHMADGSNNATPQLEIVSSSTTYYVESTEKSIKDNYPADSFEKTDDNATITSISDIRELDPNTNASLSSDALSMAIATISSNTTENVANQKIMNNTLGTDSLSSINLLSDDNFETSTNNHFNKTDIALASENLISSSVDVLNPAPLTIRNNDSINEINSNTGRLQLSTVSTSGMSHTLSLPLSNSYSKFSPSIHFSNNKIINFDNICGVTMNSEYGCTTCTHPLTCTIHSLAAKCQVTGRSRPFDELASHYCAVKENKNILSMKDIIDTSNSSSSADFGVISSASPCATSMVSALETTNDIISPNSNISSVQFSKADNDKAFMSMNLQDRNLSTSVPIFSTLEDTNGKTKTELTHSITCNKFPSMLSTVTTVSSNNQTQQNVEQSCDERAQTNNSSDDNSILTLEGIFDQTTQLEMLDSKFITEILNNTESDINFDDLDASSSQTRLQQPAVKRLKLDDNVQRVESESVFEQHQVNSFVNEPAILQQVNEFKNGEYVSNSHQDQQQSLDIQYQTELNNVLQQHQQEQLTAMEAMQFQQLLYQHCTFNNLDATVLEQDQQGHVGAGTLINGNELISTLPAEDENYRQETITYQENISKCNKNFTNMEYNIDENSSEVIELRFHVINVPSLTDEHSADVVDLTSSREDNTDQYVLPAEDELLFEITTDNHVSLISQQQHVIAELLTQVDYNAVAQTHSNSNINKDNMYSSNDRRVKPTDDSGTGIALFYDYSYLETSKTLESSIMYGETKIKSTHKHFYDEINTNMYQFICIPRPITINNFGIIKLPSTLATAFRKDLLISRKANHNPITFSRSGAAIVGNSIHSCVSGSNTITTRFGTGNVLKNTSASVLNNSASIMSNVLNEFPMGSGTGMNSTHNATISQMKQQKNVVELLYCSLSNNTNVITSPTNGTVASSVNTFVRNQQKTPLIAVNNSVSPNGKSKTITVAPVAIVNPITRLTSNTQTNISHNNNNNLTPNPTKAINSNTNNNSNNNNANATGMDRVKLIKRLPITKPTGFKTTTFFTPKIIAEMLISNQTSTTNLGLQSVSFDTLKFFRNNNLYNRRRLYKYKKNCSEIVRYEPQL